jgi:hypothetical protein
MRGGRSFQFFVIKEWIGLQAKRKVERQVKFIIENLAPASSLSFQIQLLEYFPQKQKDKDISSTGILISW